MKLYYLKDYIDGVYYRMTKVYHGYYGTREIYYDVITTGFLDRAAFFLSLDVAQEVANDLISVGEYYKVVEYVKENSDV